jgi:O-antigen/teichoic acid export membrane protein
MTILLLGFIARELGPKEYGILSFSLSLVAIGVPICKLGLDSVLIREFSNAEKTRHPVIFLSAFLMLLVSGFLSLILLNLAVTFFVKDPILYQIVTILSFTYLFFDFQIIDFYFQSQNKIKKSSLAKMMAFIISSVLKVSALKMHLSFVYLVIIFSIDGLFLGFILLILLVKHLNGMHFFKIKFASLSECISLLRSSHPLITSGIAGVLLTKTDQLMIGHFMGYESVGIYSACSRIYDGWMSFIYILSLALLPKMVSNKQSLAHDQHLKSVEEYFFLAIALSALFAFIVTIFGYLIIQILYGDLYLKAYSSLVILSWATIFSSFGYLSSRFLIVEKKESKVSQRNWGALLINVLFNFLFVPHFGIVGSAIATFLSVFIAHYVFDFLDHDLRSLSKIKNSSILKVFGK